MRAAVKDASVLDGDVRFCLVLPHESVSVPVMRRVLGGTLLGFGADAESVADLLLAATEACTNVLRHGERAEDYQVYATVERDTCLLEIANGRIVNRAQDRLGHGRQDRPNGTAVPANGHPGQQQGSQDLPRIPESGRGIAIMRACVDDLTLRGSAERGTVVQMRKRMAWADGEPTAQGTLRRAG